MGWFMHDDVGWGWMVFGMVWMIVFWGTILGLIAWGISKLGGSRGGEMKERSALDIAKERYARGELTREQFEQLRDDLRDS